MTMVTHDKRPHFLCAPFPLGENAINNICCCMILVGVIDCLS
jgi:hypothetical protein